MSNTPCPKCGIGPLSITNSRNSSLEHSLVYRNRRCRHCGENFKTNEIIAGDEGAVIDRRITGVLFLKEMEELIRRYFGDEQGLMRVNKQTREKYRR